MKNKLDKPTTFIQNPNIDYSFGYMRAVPIPTKQDAFEAIELIEKKKIIRGIILIIKLALFIPLVLKLIFEELNITETARFVIGVFYSWLILFFISMYSKGIEKQRLMIWTDQKYSIKYFLKNIILTLLIAFSILFFIAVLMKLLGLSINDGKEKTEQVFQILRNNRFLALFTVLTAGITEELIFRGYFMTRLQLFFKNKYMPILYSALFFAIAHAGYESITKVVTVFLIGLIFGMHYYKYRNIKMLIAIHFLWDFFVVLIMTR